MKRMLQLCIGNHYFSSSIVWRQSRSRTRSIINTAKHCRYIIEPTSRAYSSSSSVLNNHTNNTEYHYNNNYNMKFTTNNGAAALLLLISRTTAWTSIPTQSSILIARAVSENNNNSIRRTFYKKTSSSSVLSSSTVSISDVSIESTGEEKTESFRLFFKDSSKSTISPWHDIPFKNDDGTYNMVVEIPKMTKAKMEVATKEESNPVAQDMKKGKLRDYHGPIFWNYGCIPQTWEDPNVKHPELLCFGDNDPIDVVEIGSSALPMGTVKSVKALGVLAMIDDGELDWKVLAIATTDPLADTMNDISDVPDSILSGVREWFRWYKTPDDKPLNAFGFDEKYLDKAHAVEIIQETHDAWKALQAGTTEPGKLWIK